MPWEIEKRNGQYCVIKKTDGENEGCHATRDEAEEHMAALYASEKEVGMDFKEWSAAYKNSLPDSSFLYIEPGGKKDSEGKTTPRSLRHLPYKDANGKIDKGHLDNAASRLAQSNTGKGWLSASLRKRLQAKVKRLQAGAGKSVEEELLMDKQYDEAVAYRPLGGATSFSELDGYREAAQAAQNVRDLTWQFQDLVTNIMTDKEIENKRDAIVGLAEEFGDRVEEESKRAEGKSLWAKVKELILGKEEETLEAVPEEPAEEKDVNSFMVWKEGDQWRFLATYSNKFRDQDSPPEILSETAHRDFVKAVDDGKWPHPELWLWHIKGTKCGYCDFLAYDDRGFAIASGVVTDEDIAQNLAARNDLKTSHGMPSSEIQRDPEDNTVLNRYRSREISPLPAWAAANKLTSFSMGGNMAFPKEKRDFLVEMMGEDRTASLEAEMGDKAKEAAEEGLEFKDVTEEVVEEPEVAEEEVVEAAPAETVEEPVGDPAEEPQYVTRDEFVDAVGQMFADQGEQIATLQSTVEALGKALKELERSDEEKIAEKAEGVPALSLIDMIRGRAVGSDEARVDGRTKEGSAGPLEADSTSKDGPMPVDFLNQLWSASREQLQ